MKKLLIGAIMIFGVTLGYGQTVVIYGGAPPAGQYHQYNTYRYCYPCYEGPHSYQYFPQTYSVVGGHYYRGWWRDYQESMGTSRHLRRRQR